jgi:2-hydroxyglutarate dehydrogenase
MPHPRSFEVATPETSQSLLGKWIVAQDADQLERLNGVFNHAASHDIPMNWLTPGQAAEREPHVRAAGGALESPRTGIVDSHALMRSFLGAFEEAGGDVALGTAVTKIEPLTGGGGGGYKVVAAATPGKGVVDSAAEITADVVINAAGLGAVAISNMVLPPGRHMKAYFCKGSYFSYSLPQPTVNTLIYPAPVKGHGGLGTHLTLDMAGRMRFGPDVEWVDDPGDLAANESRIADAVLAIKTYLPGIDETGLAPDYCGIRPKIKPQGEGGVGQVDFVIRQEDGFPGFVNLVGIESPGAYIAGPFSTNPNADMW